ncbi:hypothetical protein GCM10008013_41570 [Paenibacillus segetis]|uniref:Uncharacterized protein n=1 Tax=Paenibacillus segetis TaxID=1325360 RepID=A0ABQ1YSC3_9BACL|nr:hypothetical protein GCM10008013_41570 [Paenibacillus segetis]
MNQEALTTSVANIAKVKFNTENAAGASDFDNVKGYQQNVSDKLTITIWEVGLLRMAIYRLPLPSNSVPQLVMGCPVVD